MGKRSYLRELTEVKTIENKNQMSHKKLSISHYLIAIVTAIILPLSLSEKAVAQANEFDKLVEQFNSSGGTASCANKLFSYLDKEEFTDAKVVFANNTPADSLRQQVWYWAAEWYNDTQDYPRAKKYALKALPLFKYPNTGKADCLNLLGIIHVRLGDFPTAAAYAKRSVDIDMQSGDPDRISSGFNTLAGTYMAADQPKEAETYILKGLEFANRANNPKRKAILLGMASEVYYKLNKYAQAISYADQAFRLDSLQGREPQMAIRLSQKATAFAGMKKYSDAEATFKRALPLLLKTNNHHSYAIDLNQLGILMIKQGREREAIPYFSRAAMIFSKMGDLYNLVHSHKGLYESYWKINPDSAKIEIDLFNELKDSLYHQASAEALARYNAEFGNDQLVTNNANLQNEIDTRRKARKRDILLGLVAFMLIAAMAFTVFQWHMRNQKRQMLKLIREIENLKKKIENNIRNAKIASTPPSPEASIEKSFLEQLFVVVNELLAKGDCSVTNVAAAMNMSERTFARRLKETTDQSPKMFISAIQMERCAKLLLENPTKTISEIAHLCGFEEASGFSHAFKRVYGCSPSAYKEQHK